jgi:hypothetical protein
MEVSGELHIPGKSPRYALNRRMGGPQRRSECVAEEKNPCLCLESNPGRRSPGLVAKGKGKGKGKGKVVPVIF